MANTNNRFQADGRFDKTPALELQDVPVYAKNFRGLDKYGYNPNHDKSFRVMLDPERFDIDEMKAQGWNVKERQKAEGHEDDPDMFYLDVAVKFNEYGPIIHQMIPNEETGKYRRVLLDENSIGNLDFMQITDCNLKIGHGKTWFRDGRYGIKAYLNKGQFAIQPSKFDEYFDVEEDDETPFD